MTANAFNETLLLPTDRGLKVIPVATIVRVEAISNYSKLHFSDGKKLVVARVLRKLEESLPRVQFVRIHHKHLVNIQWCQSLNLTKDLQLFLSTGEALTVSRRRANILRAKRDLLLAQSKSTTSFCTE